MCMCLHVLVCELNCRDSRELKWQHDSEVTQRLSASAQLSGLQIVGYINKN